MAHEITVLQPDANTYPAPGYTRATFPEATELYDYDVPSRTQLPISHHLHSTRVFTIRHDSPATPM